jgi:hypothetical protein
MYVQRLPSILWHAQGKENHFFYDRKYSTLEVLEYVLIVLKEMDFIWILDAPKYPYCEKSVILPSFLLNQVNFFVEVL